MAERPWTKLRLVAPVPDAPRRISRDLRYGPDDRPDLLMDVYRPGRDGDGGSLLPAVLFSHGDAPPEELRGAKDWGQFVSWAELVTANRLAAITSDHASSEAGTRIPLVLDDVRALIDHVRANGPALGIDPDRLALVAFSGGGALGLAAALGRPHPWLRCMVAYYPLLDPAALRYFAVPPGPEVPPDVIAAASPIAILERLEGRIPPTLVVKAALDMPALNATIDAFVGRARELGAPVELLVHEGGRHAFDVLDDDDRSREIIAATVDFLRRHLAA